MIGGVGRCQTSSFFRIRENVDTPKTTLACNIIVVLAASAHTLIPLRWLTTLSSRCELRCEDTAALQNQLLQNVG